MDKIHVELDAHFGRVVVLSDSVKSGEVVVDEFPFAIGPKQNSGIVCLGCYRSLNFDEDGDSLDRCDKCDWPLCGECLDSLEHREECEIFRKANVKFAGNVSSEGVCTQLDCITPLRFPPIYNTSYTKNTSKKCTHMSYPMPRNIYSRYPIRLAGLVVKIASETAFRRLVERKPVGHAMALPTNVTVVEQSPALGRYLIAHEDVPAHDVLIEELTFAYGPKLSTPVVCLGCYEPVDCSSGESICPECKWPLCSECVLNGVKDHSRECAVFRSAKVRFFPITGDDRLVKECIQLDCITPLRVLLNKEADPERWEREVAPMEYHDLARRALIDVWNADLINVAKYLRGPCKLDRFSEELIMRVVGILEVNAFEGRTAKGHPIRCLYPTTGILAHNCVPNTARSIYPSEGYRIRLRAMKNLKAGQHLHHAYTYTLNGTAARQEHIQAGKFFTCRCDRCSDPTELGTYFSSLKCTRCHLGFFSTTDPFDSLADWRCNHCQFETTADTIQKNLSIMQAEVADVQAMDVGPERLQECENLLRKYKTVLHPSHFIQTSLKQSLIEMYGRVRGYELVELPDILLERKEELCRQVLGLLNVFEPGLSRSRATLLYELHVPLVLLAKSGFIAGTLTAANLKDRIQEAVNILDECVNILKYEDDSSHEGVLGRVASQALEQLRLSMEGL